MACLDNPEDDVDHRKFLQYSLLTIEDDSGQRQQIRLLAPARIDI